ncbi:MAG: hypothetical protein LBK94_08310 [Prevotellaceae bacterium]|jgi:hypothetical protein|nr:hypothetical protein [Prevotellaceae bacterium]
MTAKDVYLKLKKHFVENGYVILSEHEYGMSARRTGKEFEFSQMMDGDYLEAVLSLVSDELLAVYDIIDETYSIDIFVKNPENNGLAEVWKKKLQDEAALLEIEKLDLKF